MSRCPAQLLYVNGKLTGLARVANAVQSGRMEWIWTVGLVAASLTPPADDRGQSPKPLPNVGDEYEISKSYETSNRTSDNLSSGSSSGRDAILERIIGVSAAGLEVEYDFPREASREDRASNWQFPARVLIPPDGPMRLLNEGELEARVEPWLKSAGWTRAVCGKTIFTWNAFRIECDPQSVIENIKAFDLISADIREGAPYRDAMARAPGVLAKEASGPDGDTFSVALEVEADAVLHARANSDVVVGEILGKPVTFAEARARRSEQEVSGTISITFDTDSVGNIWRRTKTTKLTKRADGRSEEDMSKEIVERRPID